MTEFFTSSQQQRRVDTPANPTTSLHSESADIYAALRKQSQITKVEPPAPKKDDFKMPEMIPPRPKVFGARPQQQIAVPIAQKPIVAPVSPYIAGKQSVNTKRMARLLAPAPMSGKSSVRNSSLNSLSPQKKKEFTSAEDLFD